MKTRKYFLTISKSIVYTIDLDIVRKYTNTQVYKHRMASIAIMLGGAIINAAAFIGGNYLAKALSGDSGNAALAEKVRHDKALEAYQKAYEKWQKDRTELLD